MKLLALLWLAILSIQKGYSQQITCSPIDRQAFEEKSKEIEGLMESDFGHTLVAIGKSFIGIPYVAKTLEIGDVETLVINLQGLDCTTFVENVMTFGLLLKNKQLNFDAFARTLERIRYKDGNLDGYASRLHYFSEWLANNGQKGVLKDITSEIGGVEIQKNINFMSTHRELYPFLKEDANFEKIKASEQYLNGQTLCILPQTQIETYEHLIRSGDIIALTTSINGLDITHTGMATREADGRIHLLHASTGSMAVEVSSLPLATYLKKIKGNTGIMVARMVPN